MPGRKRIRPLDSITTLRSARPGGNSRNFIDIKLDMGERAVQPESVNSKEMHINGGVSSAKVRKI